MIKKINWMKKTAILELYQCEKVKGGEQHHLSWWSTKPDSLPGSVLYKAIVELPLDISLRGVKIKNNVDYLDMSEGLVSYKEKGQIYEMQEEEAEKNKLDLSHVIYVRQEDYQPYSLWEQKKDLFFGIRKEAHKRNKENRKSGLELFYRKKKIHGNVVKTSFNEDVFLVKIKKVRSVSN